MATNTNPITKDQLWASDTSNRKYDKTTSKKGIIFQSGVVSNEVNGALNYDESSIRFLQTTAGLYDSSQDYDKNQLADILIAENGITRKRKYISRQNGLKNQPPISGGSSQTTNDIEITTINDSVTENTNNWQRVLDDSKISVKTALSQNSMYLLCNNSSAYGRLRVKVFDSSNALKCAFTIAFLGFGYSDFKIYECIYSSDIRSSRVYSGFGGIYYAGFGLMQASNGLYFDVRSTSKASRLEIEYSDCNFIPPLSSTGSQTPSSSYKPYAIREGGGTFIQDLGVIKNDYRNTGSSVGGESLEFYLFSNGFVKWTSAMSLDSNYFHQWANGNFGSLNIDASDKYLCNVGTNTGQSLGVIKSESLPNIKGKTGVFHRIQDVLDVNWHGGADSTWADGTSTGRTTGFEGALYGAREDIGSHLYLRWTSDAVTGTRTNRTCLDASRSSSIYKDGAKVFGDRIPNYLVVQAF